MTMELAKRCATRSKPMAGRSGTLRRACVDIRNLPLGEMLGGCCTLLVPVLAVLVGTGLVKIDVTPLFCAGGKLLPNWAMKGPGDKDLLVPNKEIRSFLKKVGAKGDGPGAAFPLQGVYMFDQMGPVGWIDFSNLKLDPSSKAGDINIFDCTAQAGVPEPKFGGIGPFIPGSYLIPYAEKMQYKVRFYCPSTLQDGEYCFVGDSFFGKPFSDKYEAGPMLWHLTQYDGGRKYVRDTWIVPPWATPDETYAKTHTQFHSYNLLRLMYPNGTIDEEHFSLFMEKQNGQDLAIPLSLAQYL
eukprot:s1141_g12.t2